MTTKTVVTPDVARDPHARAEEALLWIECAPDKGKTAFVEGIHYTARQCFLKALALDASSSRGWNGLGSTLTDGETVEVNGSNYTEQQCYLQAVTCDVQCHDAWCNLGSVV